MTKIEELAAAVLVSIDHITCEIEWNSSAKAIHDTLKLLYKYGYTEDDMSALLTEEYARWNESDVEDFFK